MSETGQSAVSTPPKWQDVETLVGVRGRLRASSYVLLAVSILDVLLAILPFASGVGGFLPVVDPNTLGFAITAMFVVATLILASCALEGSDILGIKTLFVIFLTFVLILVSIAPMLYLSGAETGPVSFNTGVALGIGLPVAWLPALVLTIMFSQRISARFVSWGFSGMDDKKIQTYIDDTRRGFRLSDIKQQEVVIERKKISQEWKVSDLMHNAEFARWAESLDSYLAATGANTRAAHFTATALAYGFLNRMEPAAFVKTGYNQFANPAEIVGAPPTTSAPSLAEAEARDETPVAPVPSPAVETPTRTSPIDMSMIEKLERLAALHKSGALTDEEFTAEKARLLIRED